MVRYEYGPSTNLVAVKNHVTNAVYAQNITYNPLNVMSHIEFGNAVYTDQDFDEEEKSLRLTNIKTIANPTLKGLFKSPIKSLKQRLSSEIQNESFEYNDVSTIVRRIDPTTSLDESFEYDDLNRLTSSQTASDTRSWSFDEIGNITSKTVNGASKDYSYNSNRKQILTSVGAESFSFDNYGNITADGTRTYFFNWNNELTKVNNSGNLVTYKYDETGIRTKKVNTALNTESLFFDKFMELKNGVPLRHIYAGERLIASVEGNGTPIYSHPDHQRSTVARTDSTGNVLQLRDYAAFGEKRSETASSTVKFNYTSQYEDEDTNLLYYKHRYYLPRLGRFVSADPLYAEEMDKRGFNSQELNLYAYVGNNPVNGIDPEGFSFLDFGNASQASYRDYAYGSDGRVDATVQASLSCYEKGTTKGALIGLAAAGTGLAVGGAAVAAAPVASTAYAAAGAVVNNAEVYLALAVGERVSTVTKNTIETLAPNFDWKNELMSYLQYKAQAPDVSMPTNYTELGTLLYEFNKTEIDSSHGTIGEFFSTPLPDAPTNASMPLISPSDNN